MRIVGEFCETEPRLLAPFVGLRLEYLRAPAAKNC